MNTANSFGNILKVTTFGESHGTALGAVIEGVPAGLQIDESILSKNLARRRPGSQNIVSSRQEADIPEILSGVYEGKSLGTPIAVIVRNQDARSQDYQEIAQSPRAGHADDVWKNKFGHSDPRGGGRSSGRETLSRVIAGSFAEMILAKLSAQTTVQCFSQCIADISLEPQELQTALQKLSSLSQSEGEKWLDSFPARFPHAEKSKAIEELLLKAKSDGKSYGGLAYVHISKPPANLGQPVFHKLKADLASAILGIGATCSVDIGEADQAVMAEGSQFHTSKDTNIYGGIRGGISTGENMHLHVGFKPTSSVLDVAKKGRHDPCILPRAVIVVQAMSQLVLADHLLWSRLDRI